MTGGSTAESLYERDYYAWTRQQAAESRDLAERRVNVPLDLANLAEEVEDLGKASATPSAAKSGGSSSTC